MAGSGQEAAPNPPHKQFRVLLQVDLQIASHTQLLPHLAHLVSLGLVQLQGGSQGVQAAGQLEAALGHPLQRLLRLVGLLTGCRL